MVAAATLHAFSTELLVGSMTFSVLATVLCFGESIMDKFGPSVLRGLDFAAYLSAIFSLCCIPLVVFTGNASGDASSRLSWSTKCCFQDCVWSVDRCDSRSICMGSRIVVGTEKGHLPCGFGKSRIRDSRHARLDWQSHDSWRNGGRFNRDLAPS